MGARCCALYLLRFSLLILNLQVAQGKSNPFMMWSSQRFNVRSSGIYSASALPNRQRYDRGYLMSTRIVSFRFPHFINAFDSNDRKKQISVMDVGRGNLIVVNTKTRTIVRSHRGITSKAEAVAVDWSTGNVYWTDEGRSWIFVTTADFKHSQAIQKNVAYPKGIAVYPEKGYIFWSQLSPGSGGPKIMRATMSGDSPVTLAETFGTPSSIAIDYETDRVYWIDISDMTIHHTSINGKTESKTMFRSNRLSLNDLHIYKDSIYVTASKQNQILMLNKTSGLVLHRMNTTSPKAITIAGGNMQTKVSGPCDIDNGGCEQFCFPQPPGNRRKCGCSMGMILGPDGTSCGTKILEKNFFLVVDSDMQWIYQVSANGKSFSKLSIPNLSIPVQVEYDPETTRVYWTDIGSHTVNRVNIDGSNHVVLAKDNVRQPTGIALDKYSRNLYWTDEGTSTINVIRTDGTHRKTLISNNITLPRGIILDPVSGFLWWSDWGKKTIEKSGMDGSRREVIINKDVYWVNGLSVDFANNRLYWCDAKRDTIESSTLDGSDRKIEKKMLSSKSHAFGITLTKDYIYWTDWNRPTLQRMLKKDSLAEVEIFGPKIFDKASDIHGFFGETAADSNATNPCQNQNGNCSGLCIPIPKPHPTKNQVLETDQFADYLSSRICLCGNDYNGTCDKPTDGMDGEPPSFGDTCPKSMVLTAPSCYDKVLVEYPLPVATDNSGNITLERPANPPPVNLSEGIYEQRYTAIDGAGNHDICRFSITVKVVRCPSPEDYIIGLPVSIVNSTCEYLYGSRILLQCLNGTSDGPQQIECGQDGEWVGDPMCYLPIETEQTTAKPTTKSPENNTTARTIDDQQEHEKKDESEKEEPSEKPTGNIQPRPAKASALPYDIVIPVVGALIIIIFIGIAFKRYRYNNMPLMAAMEKTLAYNNNDENADTFTLDVGDANMTDPNTETQGKTVPPTDAENNKQSDLPLSRNPSQSDASIENPSVRKSNYGTIS
ncbi:uncharacterized protein LOC143450032 [Clavelina lepadiformis]|uniref:uncharacterized protein LOC143450032 n=1 Tax=Clavelina lepadiformis TaxID=159417 RepID=UPI004040F29B